MKKLFTLLTTLAVAFSLTMPVYAKGGRKKSDTTGHKGKAHMQHAKKKGATKGEKEGQENPTKPEGPK